LDLDLQFSYAIYLLFMQTLGIGHAFSSFIWLCGPITGLVVGFNFIFTFEI
jgi:solute carrier family 45 protein 1/2/4